MGMSGAGVLLCCRGCRGSQVSSAFHLEVEERGDCTDAVISESADIVLHIDMMDRRGKW